MKQRQFHLDKYLEPSRIEIFIIICIASIGIQFTKYINVIKMKQITIENCDTLFQNCNN